MANIVKEIFDRIPQADGGFRRRLTSGILLIAIFSAGIIVMDKASTDSLISLLNLVQKEWKLLSGTGFIIIVFSIIFTIGYLIEIVGAVFVRRIFSVAFGRYFYRNVLNMFDQVGKYTRQEGINKPTRSSKTLDVTETEAETYQRLPEYVQEGLTNPYDRRFEVAYRYLVSIAPDDEKNWLIKLDANNQNLFSIICAIFIGPIILSILSLWNLGPEAVDFRRFSIAITAILIFALLLSFIYSALLRVTIANALDMLSLRGVAQISPIRIGEEYDGGIAENTPYGSSEDEAYNPPPRA